MSRESEIGVVAGGIGQIAAVAAGLVRIRAVDNPALGFVAELDGPVTPPSGYAQWGQIERPKKLPISDFAGLSPLALPIPILLDRWSSRGSIEPEIKVIETMAGRHGIGRPPALIVEGPGIPFSYERDQSIRYVITDFSWGDDKRSAGPSGELCFAQLTITLSELTLASAQVTDDAAAKLRKFVTVSKSNPYTLARIAKKHKITTARILALNTGRKGVPADPDHRIKAGVKVRVA